MRHRPLLGLAVLAIGCSPTAPTPPPEAEPFDPPLAYEGWHAQAEECFGVEDPFDRIQWFLVPGVKGWESPNGHGRVSGEFYPPRTIYLAERRYFDQGLVMHEIGHYLIGDFEHESPLFALCSIATEVL